MKNDFFKYNLENNELFYYPFLRFVELLVELAALSSTMLSLSGACKYQKESLLALASCV
jgi:hypothetical protein